MASPSGSCPNCARPYGLGQAFCGYCGAQVGAPGTPGPYPVPPGSGAWGTPVPATPRSPDQTITGLLLMLIAFGLAWIPFVDFVGGILTLVGLIYLWNGRRELGPVHHAEVKVGVLLLVLGIVVALIGAFVLVTATFALSFSFNGTQPLVTHPAPSLALKLAIGATLAVGGALVAACWVKLPYSLADPASRRLLLLAGGLYVAFDALYAAAEIQSLSAFASLFSPGGSPGPLPSPIVVGLLLAVPDLLFVVLYYRVRRRLLDGGFPSAPALASTAR